MGRSVAGKRRSLCNGLNYISYGEPIESLIYICSQCPSFSSLGKPLPGAEDVDRVRKALSKNEDTPALANRTNLPVPVAGKKRGRKEEEDKENAT
jgi:hypothetical protein